MVDPLVVICSVLRRRDCCSPCCHLFGVKEKGLLLPLLSFVRC